MPYKPSVYCLPSPKPDSAGGGIDETEVDVEEAIEIMVPLDLVTFPSSVIDDWVDVVVDSGFLTVDSVSKPRDVGLSVELSAELSLTALHMLFHAGRTSSPCCKHMYNHKVFLVTEGKPTY